MSKTTTENHSVNRHPRGMRAKLGTSHLELLPALVRCALVNAADATRQRVRELCEALEEDGEPQLAGRLRELLDGVSDEAALRQLVEDAPNGTIRRLRLEAALDAYRGPEDRNSRLPGNSPATKRMIENLPTVQRIVLNHIRQGKFDGEIASDLNRSINTVRNHVKALLKRFDVRSRTELLAKTAAYLRH
jgi:DNA-binding CsgD family transcriptional regulator